MSLSSQYFLRLAELRSAEEEPGPPSRTGGMAGDYRRSEINAAWQQAAEDQERESAYQASLANSRGEQEYPLMDGL